MRPYIFEFNIEDPEDNESSLIRVEADSPKHFFCFEGSTIIDFHSLPEKDQAEIIYKIDTYYFFRDAEFGWSKT